MKSWTEFALRLVLTGHKDIPRENDSDFLAQAEAAFVPPQPKKMAAKKPKTAVAKDAKRTPGTAQSSPKMHTQRKKAA